jgi:hypothetical protein
VKKTFPLEHPRHKPAQALNAIKHEVRKYIKRERRKSLPDDAEFWAFECRVGVDGPERSLHVGEIIGAIDTASKEGWATVYIEIIAKPGQRGTAPEDAGNESAG